MKLRAMVKSLSVLMSLSILFSLFPLNAQAAETVTSDRTGTHGGYYFSFWNQGGGSVVMTLGDGGNYSVNWSNCSNFTCGKGWATGSPNRIVNFTGSFNGGNNGYLALYGWTKNALIEYYVIENYGQWVPPGGNSIGTMTSDGGTYNIYKMVRTNQPSIIGTATFDQFFSVRTSKRSSGSITFANHANAWKSKGLNLGSTWDYQIMESEGYQSSGSANITVSEGGSPTPTQATNTPTQVTERSAFTTIEAEEFNSLNSANARSIGTGVGYIDPGDSIVYNKINFGGGAGSFKAKVANGNTTTTTIQLRLGSPSGTLIGSLDVAPTGGWDTYEELSTSVSGASSTQDLYLCLNGSVNIDSFLFGSGVVTTPNQQTPPPSSKIYLGDVDENGKVDSIDFGIYRQYLLGMVESLPLAADVDQSGSKNSIDFGMLRQHLLGIITLGTIDNPNATPIATPTTNPSTPAGNKFHCFLLLGQSNMAGWPKAQDADKVKNDRILALGYDNNQWGVAVPPLHEAYQGAIGPGDWFAKTLINQLPQGDTIGLIPCAISGEKIETFMKNGGSKYNWILQRAKLAQQRGGVIEGILFHQGESNNTQTDWPGKVNTLVEDLKKDLGLGDIPFLAGELLYSGGCAAHNTQVNRLPSIVKNCYVVSASGLSGDPADSWGLHFNHDSQVEFGKRYAAKMAQALGLSGTNTSTVTTTPKPTPAQTPTPSQGGVNGNVYLCFDDGPNNSNTQTLINNLKSAGCNNATFFIWGNKIGSNSMAWDALKNSGFSLQNHSWTHSHMSSWSYQQAYNDIKQCSDAIVSSGKPQPTKIRLPYLESGSGVQQACSALGLTIVQPSVDSQDWNGASTQSIINACNNLKNGGNVLMHDGYQTTNSAISTVVQNLKNRGLGFAQY